MISFLPFVLKFVGADLSTGPDVAPAPTPTLAPPAPSEAHPTVLVLEGDFHLTAAVLFCLSRQPGLRVHMLGRVPRSPFRFSRYVRSYHHFAADKPEVEFVAFMGRVVAETEAEVLLPIDVPGMRLAIAHREELEKVVRVLPLPTAEAYETATDKSRLAAFMQAHDIPAPDTILDIRHGLAAKLVGFRFPVLLKPVEGAGGRGITRYESAAAVLAAVAALPPEGSYIIQNCVDGYDIDCNVLYQQGRLVAYSVQKGLVPAAWSVYAPTEAIEFVRSKAVLTVVDDLMTALSWNGVAHLDLRYDARTDQMRVIEINTRFWLTVVGSALTAQVNFPVLACRAALGQALQPGPSRLGRYIPLARLLAYRWRSRREPARVRFPLREVSIWALLGDPLPRLYRLLWGKPTMG
ncbi:MAG: hypothetical protein NVSMB30_21200 [Hymenobacter sp.]